jgi:molecular chaperone HtpG
MFADVKPSYDRLNAWYVGEIHIDPTQVIPNARRDGFEEDAQWLKIRDSLTFEFLETLARDAYARSKKKRYEAERIVEDVDKLLTTHRAVVANPRATYDQLVGLMSTAKTVRRNVARALTAAEEADVLAREDEDEEARQGVGDALRERLRAIEEVESSARLLVGKFSGAEEQLVSLRARIREEVVREVMAILKHLVTLEVAQQVKRELDRTAGIA